MKVKKCLIPDCSGTRIVKGYCSKHYQRLQRTGDPLKTKHAPQGDPIRFLLSAVSSQSDDCIIWPYTKGPQGYGRVRYQGKNRRAHRLALSLADQVAYESPMQALHGPCNNPSCVNPSHLSWGDQAQNEADKSRDGTRLLGGKSHRAKLTEPQAMRILADPRAGAVLAREYEIHKSTVYLLRSGKTWKHLRATQ